MCLQIRSHKQQSISAGAPPFHWFLQVHFFHHCHWTNTPGHSDAGGWKLHNERTLLGLVPSWVLGKPVLGPSKSCIWLNPCFWSYSDSGQIKVRNSTAANSHLFLLLLGITDLFLWILYPLCIHLKGAFFSRGERMFLSE